jgi:hypothetical protein
MHRRTFPEYNRIFSDHKKSKFNFLNDHLKILYYICTAETKTANFFEKSVYKEERREQAR